MSRFCALLDDFKTSLEPKVTAFVASTDRVPVTVCVHLQREATPHQHFKSG